MAQDTVSGFADLYQRNWISGMRKKLGLFSEEAQDQSLVERLLSMMHKYGADYTNTFRALTTNNLSDTVLFGTREFTEWHEEWKARLKRQKETEETSRYLMQNSNPAVIPRNHRVEEALDTAVKERDYSVMERLLEVLKRPYAYSADQIDYCALPAKSSQPYRTFCGT